MSFVSERAEFEAESPLFALILSNSLVSQIPGVSGAGEDPESSLYVPPLDAELLINGELSGDLTPNTPTGCPTPATITLSMMDLIGMHPLMIAAGLNKPVMVPHMDLGESAGDFNQHRFHRRACRRRPRGARDAGPAGDGDCRQSGRSDEGVA